MGELSSRKQLAFEERHSPRPDSVSSGSVRAEPDAAVGRYLEQALRSAMGSPETPADGGHPAPPPPPPPPQSERADGKPTRTSPPPAQCQQQQPAAAEGGQDGVQKPARARTTAGARGGRAGASASLAGRSRTGVSPRGGGRGGVTRPASASVASAARAEQRAPLRPGQTQVRTAPPAGPAETQRKTLAGW